MADHDDFTGNDLSTQRTRCGASTASGGRCRMAPLVGTERCWNHTPALAAQRAEARQRGGKARGYPAATDPGPVTLATTAQILSETERLYREVSAARVSPDTARTLNALLGRAVELLNVGSFEDRLAALEAQLHQGPRRVA